MSGSAEEFMERAGQARRETRLEDARRDWLEAVAICRRVGANTGLARALCGLGQIERDSNENDAALIHYQEAVEIYRRENNLLRLAYTVRHVGDIYLDEGRYEHAAPCYEEALKLYRAHPQSGRLDLANTLRGWSLLQGKTGDCKKARAGWLEARELYAAEGVVAGVVEAGKRLAEQGKPLAEA